MVWDDLFTVGEVPFADRALHLLSKDFAVEEFSHFAWRPEFPISARMMGIFDPTHWSPESTISSESLATAAET